MDEADVVRALSALAQQVRLTVFRALVVAGAGGATPTVLGATLCLSPSSLSFHLKELMNAGLVTQQRNGRFLVYRAAYEQVDALMGYLTENCCDGSACVVSGASATSEG